MRPHFPHREWEPRRYGRSGLSNAFLNMEDDLGHTISIVKREVISTVTTMKNKQYVAIYFKRKSSRWNIASIIQLCPSKKPSPLSFTFPLHSPLDPLGSQRKFDCCSFLPSFSPLVKSAAADQPHQQGHKILIRERSGQARRRRGGGWRWPYSQTRLPRHSGPIK